MPLDELQKSSLAYRNNEQAIWNGQAPVKYTRLLPYIPGDSVLEIGAAEGVLALLMAEAGKRVLALERRQDRWAAACRLRLRWQELGKNVDNCQMVNADIRACVLPPQLDTVVAVRSIYYLRDDTGPILENLGRCHGVKNIVLCGNKHRAARFFADGFKENSLGKYNYYASAEGMIEILKASGYQIAQTVMEGDPIVVGSYKNPA